MEYPIHLEICPIGICRTTYSCSAAEGASRSYAFTASFTVYPVRILPPVIWMRSIETGYELFSMSASISINGRNSTTGNETRTDRPAVGAYVEVRLVGDPEAGHPVLLGTFFEEAA